MTEERKDQTNKIPAMRRRISTPPSFVKRRQRLDGTGRVVARDGLVVAKGGYLFADEGENIVPVLRELRIVDQVFPDSPIAGNVDFHGSLQLSRAAREDEALVAEKGGFIHVVRDEKDGLPGGNGDPI